MKRIRDSQTIIGMLEDGEAAVALSKEITDTLAALKDLSGGRPKAKHKGSVTLRLDIEVEGGAATISADISSKKPKQERGASFYWVLDDGSLTTEHPRQMNLLDPVRDVSKSL